MSSPILDWCTDERIIQTFKPKAGERVFSCRYPALGITCHIVATTIEDAMFQAREQQPYLENACTSQRY